MHHSFLIANPQRIDSELANLRSDAPTTIKLIHDYLSNLTADMRLTLASIGLNVKYILD